MAAASAGMADATTCFQRCYQKLMIFVFREDEATRSNLNFLLDELIALDCNSVRVKNEMGNTLLKKLSSLVPIRQERLVMKVCHIIHNFVKYKLVSSLYPDCLHQLADFVMKALRYCPNWALPDILRALAILLEDYCEPFMQYQDLLVGKPGILITILEASQPDIGALGEATHCLRCLALRAPEKDGLNSAHVMPVFTSLVGLLHRVPSLDLHQNVQCKVLVDALMAIHGLLSNTKVDVEPHLGALLAAVKAYMFQGLGRPITIPPQLFPTITAGFDTKSPPTKPPTTSAPSSKTESDTPSKSRSKKTRKKKTASKDDENQTSADASEEMLEEKGGSKRNGASLSGELAALSLQPSWARATSSDSDFSDTEGGQMARYHMLSTRVRIAAFTCLAAISKVADKKSMFGYWPFFIPDSAAAGNSPQVQTLFTSVLKDPSPKCRMGALVALTAMLDGTKQFLAAAEESSNVRTAFTPLSNVLGAMIRELHRALLQALVVENYNLTLTQLIKCLSTLVINVPYHRLQPGLLSRVVKQVRHFLGHKDSNVRVACLTCLGALVSHQPPLMEVFHIIQAPSPPVGTASFIPTTAASGTSATAATTSNVMLLPGPENTATYLSPCDSGVESSESPASVRSDGSRGAGRGEGGVMVNAVSGHSSGGETPVLAVSPGMQTPIFTDQMLQAQAHETSWLVKLCMRNVLPQPAGNGMGSGESPALEPLPIRLESLQVLANLTKGYFPVVRGKLSLMQDLILKCLEDPDPTVKLHGCKVLEELAQAVLRDMQDAQNGTTPTTHTLGLQDALSLWLPVLNGPLLHLLEMSRNNPVRASACDCISNIGQDVFQQLPAEIQQKCIKQVLQLTASEDRLVVSAAVRVLGVYVLYPSLSQKVAFIADVANSILKCMAVPSVNVKIKAAWALGNLCDALVVNKDKGDMMFMDQFSDMLLSSMLSTAATATQDSDKVKCNAVRAVGNILRYLPARSLSKSHMVEAVASSVKVVIKTMHSGPMKVRWNSCYAIANMFRNPLLLSGETPWLTDVLTALCQVVKDCKNFKVRINAALALSIPTERRHYGGGDMFVKVWNSLVESLKTAEEITDFAEFRYRDSLTDQVCAAVLHMLSLSECADIVTILPMLQTCGTALQGHMQRYVSQQTPAKVSTLKAVHGHLTTLAAQNPCPELTVGLSLLTEACLLKTEAAPEPTQSPPTAFRQVYD